MRARKSMSTVIDEVGEGHIPRILVPACAKFVKRQAARSNAGSYCRLSDSASGRLRCVGRLSEELATLGRPTPGRWEIHPRKMGDPPQEGKMREASKQNGLKATTAHRSPCGEPPGYSPLRRRSSFAADLETGRDTLGRNAVCIV